MFEPPPGDRFALGLRTAGRQARVPFGDAALSESRHWPAVHGGDLADLPEHGVHDDHGLSRTAEVRVSGSANIRTSLIYRKRVRNFGTNPDADEPGPSTLDHGETPSDFDPGPAAWHGYHFTHLNQLALEHLLGVRG
ncbi:hypothetical protein ACFOY2_42490 [Nonomuraea purpurea]|uniref:Uncharacterized protein n=1 Tax=Nonomuraea purpurea TaxID=1849276 RepID=A0ABV8GJ25_9ACTN